MIGDLGFETLSLIIPTPVSIEQEPTYDNPKVAYLARELNKERHRAERLFDALREIRKSSCPEARAMATKALEEDER